VTRQKLSAGSAQSFCRVSGEEYDGFHVVGHREDADAPERERKLLQTIASVGGKWALNRRRLLKC
jgi:hypothetical protein